MLTKAHIETIREQHPEKFTDISDEVAAKATIETKNDVAEALDSLNQESAYQKYMREHGYKAEKMKERGVVPAYDPYAGPYDDHRG